MKKPTAIASTEWTGGVPSAATVVVKRVEGFFGKPYDDNGALPGGTWTIGYGSIIDRDGQPVTPQTPAITEADAELLLQRDMQGAAQELRQRIRLPLLEHEAAALVSWTYNLGGNNLAKSTLLQCVNAGQKSRVPEEMRKWIYHEGKPLVGLLRRRWAEAAIFLGRDPVEACVLAWKYINELNDWPAI